MFDFGNYIHVLGCKANWSRRRVKKIQAYPLL